MRARTGKKGAISDVYRTKPVAEPNSKLHQEVVS